MPLHKPMVDLDNHGWTEVLFHKPMVAHWPWLKDVYGKFYHCQPWFSYNGMTIVDHSKQCYRGWHFTWALIYQVYNHWPGHSFIKCTTTDHGQSMFTAKFTMVNHGSTIMVRPMLIMVNNATVVDISPGHHLSSVHQNEMHQSTMHSALFPSPENSSEKAVCNSYSYMCGVLG